MPSSVRQVNPNRRRSGDLALKWSNFAIVRRTDGHSRKNFASARLASAALRSTATAVDATFFDKNAGANWVVSSHQDVVVPSSFTGRLLRSIRAVAASYTCCTGRPSACVATATGDQVSSAENRRRGRTRGRCVGLESPAAAGLALAHVLAVLAARVGREQLARIEPVNRSHLAAAPAAARRRTRRCPGSGGATARRAPALSRSRGSPSRHRCSWWRRPAPAPAASPRRTRAAPRRGGTRPAASGRRDRSHRPCPSAPRAAPPAPVVSTAPAARRQG